MKIRKELCDVEKKSYASDIIILPPNGVDCSEGCNPYGFPNSVNEIVKNYDANKLSAYPHSQAAHNAIINYWKNQTSLTKENILLVDGSVAGLYIINTIFAEVGAKVVGYAPQFTDYVANARFLGMDYTAVTLLPEDNYAFKVESILQKMTSDVSVVYLDNPNNPTGQIISIQDIEKVLIKAKELGICVVVDEAYGDFMEKEESAIRFLDHYDNLIVLRTLSKGFGLAGIRAGYILTSTKLINYMKKITNPYAVGELSRDIIGAVLTEENDLAEHIKYFSKAQEILESLMGKTLIMAKSDPRVPICLLKHNDPSVDLPKLLFEHGVLSVPGEEFETLDKTTARIRIPKQELLDKLFEAIKSIGE